MEGERETGKKGQNSPRNADGCPAWEKWKWTVSPNYTRPLSGSHGRNAHEIAGGFCRRASLVWRGFSGFWFSVSDFGSGVFSVEIS